MVRSRIFISLTKFRRNIKSKAASSRVRRDEDSYDEKEEEEAMEELRECVRKRPVPPIQQTWIDSINNVRLSASL